MIISLLFLLDCSSLFNTVYSIIILWFINSGGSKEGATARPLLRPIIFSISCSFWGNMTKSYVGAPDGRRPLLHGILDPPLIIYCVPPIHCSSLKFFNGAWKVSGGGTSSIAIIGTDLLFFKKVMNIK